MLVSFKNGCHHGNSDSNILGYWMSLPITATLWIYVFGAISVGVSSLYYLWQPERFSISYEAGSTHTDTRHTQSACTHTHTQNIHIRTHTYTHTNAHKTHIRAHTHTYTHTHTHTHTHTLNKCSI